MGNLWRYIVPDSRSVEEKAVRWYSDLLLGRKADDQTGFNNGTVVPYGMCPPITLWEFYDSDLELPNPTHFMR